MPRCLLLNIIAAAILSLSASSPARAVACGELPKTEVAKSSVSQALDTTSAGFFDVAGSTVSFSIGGIVKTCPGEFQWGSGCTVGCEYRFPSKGTLASPSLINFAGP